MTKEVTGYLHHRAGSKKGEIHQIFDAKGRDAAEALAKKRKIADSTIRTWVNTWARDAKGGSAKAKPAKSARSAVKAKTTAKKPAAKAAKSAKKKAA